jgi:hypothetical protein
VHVSQEEDNSHNVDDHGHTLSIDARLSNLLILQDSGGGGDVAEMERDNENADQY